MSIYHVNFTGLLGICATLFLAQRKTAAGNKICSDSQATASKQPVRDTSQRAFFMVYALVMGADWLQGPYLYPLYHEEHHLAPATISTLFTMGFLSGAVGGVFIGRAADRWGRKAACLFFCLIYSLSCLLTVFPVFGIVLLFTGRVLGGLGTSLLFSVFESWMVADFARRRLGKQGGDLSRTFGTMSTLNSLVAIGSGVASEWLVGVSGTRKAPFLASVGLLGVAAWSIATHWTENYGDTKDTGPKSESKQQVKLWDVLIKPQVLSLGLASTMFEGSMYLFVFFWTPALKVVQTSSSSLPYGIIFASFMASTLASSLAFNTIMQRQLLRYTTLLVVILGTSTVSFYLLARPNSEQATFWLFCLFEAMVGMYFPCMGCLKGQVVEDSVRARVYGALRIPLNVFVVFSLLFMGDKTAYESVFSTCAKLLLASCGALWGLSLGADAR